MITRLLTMSRGAARALAESWFIRGFQAASRSLNGDTVDLARYPAVRSLLAAEFDRQWNSEHT